MQTPTVIKLLLFCLLAASVHAQEECYFAPPEGWLLTDPKYLAPNVRIGFLRKGKKEFCPSLNLAVEKVNVPIEKYLAAVKKIHQSNLNDRWRDLGKIKTQAGEARLTEIDTTSPFGPVRLLQLILLKDGCAYILTAGALREEFSSFYKEFEQAFHSLNVTSDLFSAIADPARRESLQKRCDVLKAALSQKRFQKDHWQPFQKTVIDDFSDMGAHWQILLLKQIQENLDKIRT